MNSLCRQIATDKTKNNINMLHDMNDVLISRPNLILDQHMASPDLAAKISSTAQLYRAQPNSRRAGWPCAVNVSIR
jgi:hypothetical protein